MTASSRPPSRRSLGWRRVLAWATVALALGAGFAAYQTPERVVDLADRVWAACFG